MAVAKYYKNWSEEDSGIDVFNRCMYMKLHIYICIIYIDVLEFVNKDF